MSAKTAVATFAGRLLRTVDVRRSETQRSLPRVQVDLGRSISGSNAHVAAAAIALICVALLNPPPLLWLAAAVAAVVMAIRPATGSAALYGAAIGVALAYEPVDLLSVRPFVLLLLVPAMVTLGALTQSLPRHARVELAALAPAARRFAIIEVGAQSLALIVALLSRRDIEAMGIAIAGAVACAAAVWALRIAIRESVDEMTQLEPQDD